MMNHFEIIVIGGGHAGLEAAVAAANMGCSVGLLTMDKHAIGRMSCNPAIGGTAKGHLVREVDALGGVMGKIADKTGIQFRMLNKSKGPAVWSPRCQSDRKLYSEEAYNIANSTNNLSIVEANITRILIENKKIIGVGTIDNKDFTCSALILSSGTFLNGKMHIGLTSTKGGRFGEQPSTGITQSLIDLGFESGRLKTGTPPRLKKDSINWDILEEQPGDKNPQPFSYSTDLSKFPFLPQLSCHITYTNMKVHKILEKGFEQSPMFTGRIKGIGPRYCPSIEDKIVRFADKEKHQLFLEPEGLDSEQIYVNGFSSSLPEEIQFEALKNIKGLEECEMIRPGYAVEYDFFPPHQVDLTLETKLIEGLYFAGQINGTSGYEEAAAQGILAGINAANKIQGKPNFVLKRSEAYIGVLIDDLVNKSTEEPYRMFTSRAEYRLLLRQDNADRRLSSYGFNFNLIDENKNKKIAEREILINECIKLFHNIKIHARDINNLLEKNNSPLLDSTGSIAKLSKRAELNLKDLIQFIDVNTHKIVKNLVSDKIAFEQVEIELKYEGYIKRQQELINKFEKYESANIPLSLNYLTLNALSAEGKEKLNRIKPRSIGQASRISGVTPSDISILLVYLKK
ncbi:MAG: tRNA uridine-5-carboxymethylaminomethyl(34) synthesis enzyme MnmG [Bacteroidetes bacterium]|nr:tRNA uridine-5-carboxymethylaminomethyl(34) synthesis enzyme MnmG [Bacteroidota bacterium]